MELRDYEERYFWKKIYDSAIRSGMRSVVAKFRADQAVENLRESPVVKQTHQA